MTHAHPRKSRDLRRAFRPRGSVPRPVAHLLNGTGAHAGEHPRITEGGPLVSRSIASRCGAAAEIEHKLPLQVVFLAGKTDCPCDAPPLSWDLWRGDWPAAACRCHRGARPGRLLRGSAFRPGGWRRGLTLGEERPRGSGCWCPGALCRAAREGAPPATLSAPHPLHGGRGAASTLQRGQLSAANHPLSTKQ